jgi:hypothetical protein
MLPPGRVRHSPYQNNSRANITMREVRARRRKAGVCVNNIDHGLAWKGGRCKACWEKKVKAERVGGAT